MHVPPNAPPITLTGKCPELISGKLVFTDTALSFWSGIDPKTGKVSDVNHPLYQQSLAGKMCFFCALKGSTAAPGALLEWLGGRSAPAVIITLNFEPMVFSAFAAMELIDDNCSVPYVWCQDTIDKSKVVAALAQAHLAKIINNRLYITKTK